MFVVFLWFLVGFVLIWIYVKGRKFVDFLDCVLDFVMKEINEGFRKILRL